MTLDEQAGSTHEEPTSAEHEPASGRSTADDNAGQRFVTFDVGKGFYCLPAEEVAEVSHPLPITKLPRMEGPVSGISPLRGEILAVIDLRRLLGEERTSKSSKTKFVVLRSSPPACQVALPVDRIRDVALITPEKIAECSTGPSVVSAVSEGGSRKLNILDAARIRATFSEQED